MCTDMKRLCEAIQPVAQTLSRDDSSYVFAPEFAEAIVRAVLMELREPSREMERAGGGQLVYDDFYEKPVQIGHHIASTAFTAMIDCILTEPATT